MTSFIDFKLKNMKINIQASEVKEIIKFSECFFSLRTDCILKRSNNTVIVTSENFNKTIKTRSILNFYTVITLYNSFLEKQLECNLFKFNI
jgi:hypothetical protein